MHILFKSCFQVFTPPNVTYYVLNLQRTSNAYSFQKLNNIFQYLPNQHVKIPEDLDACNVWPNIQNKQ